MIEMSRDSYYRQMSSLTGGSSLNAAMAEYDREKAENDAQQAQKSAQTQSNTVNSNPTTVQNTNNISYTQSTTPTVSITPSYQPSAPAQTYNTYSSDTASPSTSTVNSNYSTNNAAATTTTTVSNSVIDTTPNQSSSAQQTTSQTGSQNSANVSNATNSIIEMSRDSYYRQMSSLTSGSSLNAAMAEYDREKAEYDANAANKTNSTNNTSTASTSSPSTGTQSSGNTNTAAASGNAGNTTDNNSTASVSSPSTGTQSSGNTNTAAASGNTGNTTDNNSTASASSSSTGTQQYNSTNAAASTGSTDNSIDNSGPDDLGVTDDGIDDDVDQNVDSYVNNRMKLLAKKGGCTISAAPEEPNGLKDVIENSGLLGKAGTTIDNYGGKKKDGDCVDYTYTSKLKGNGFATIAVYKVKTMTAKQWLNYLSNEYGGYDSVRNALSDLSDALSDSLVDPRISAAVSVASFALSFMNTREYNHITKAVEKAKKPNAIISFVESADVYTFDGSKHYFDTYY